MIIMEKNEMKNPSEDLLNDIYKSAKMGTQSVTHVIGKTKNEGIRRELASQLDKYHEFESEARNKLIEMSLAPKEPTMMDKVPADMSIAMSTMIDSSDSSIAKIMIDGYNMGIIELQKSVNHAKEKGVDESVMNIASGVIEFEERSIENMKQYL